MKPELVFATHNQHKLSEIKALLGDIYQVKSLTDIGLNDEIPENEETLEGNALAKARFVKARTGLNCFADDTGLLVDALNGEPGVYSARYAGPGNNANENMNKLLSNLGKNPSRKARFKTIIALIEGEKEILFEGVAEGEITFEKLGEKGFGYDPIFIPAGFTKTFAQMTMEEKSSISHRGKAVQKLVEYLHKK